MIFVRSEVDWWYLVKVNLLVKGVGEGGVGELGRLARLQSPWIRQVPGDGADISKVLEDTGDGDDMQGHKLVMML